VLFAADCIFQHTSVRAKDAILELIGRERENETIDRDLIKSVLSIFIDVGMDNGTETYETAFQSHLLEALKDYYEAKAALWIQSESCAEYLLKAEQCLADEEDRAVNYLHSISKDPIVDAVLTELLRKVQVPLIEKDTGCRAMLRDGKLTDLARMFRLFHRCRNFPKAY
jgi:cullin 1